VNGDGNLDLVVGMKPAAGAPRVYLNDGARWQPAPQWQLPVDFVTINTLSKKEDLGVQLTDVNGDGLADLVRSQDVIRTSDPETVEATIREVWLNDGTAWAPPPQDCDTAQPSGYCFPSLMRTAFFREFAFIYSYNRREFYSGGTQLVDVNGDGLPDLLTARKNGRRAVYLNDGKKGWQPAPARALPFDFVRSDDLSTSFTPVDLGVRLADVNGDGLADVLKAYSDFRVTEDQRPLVCLNNGAGWNTPGAWIFPGADTPDPADDVLFGGVTNTTGLLHRDYGVQLVDLDGDRHPDVLVRRNAPARRAAST